MPGHKHQARVHPAILQLLGDAAFRADLSEAGGVDYLHSPRGPLLKAQRLAAAAVGADQTFFLVNGSTVGNHAAILSTVRGGQKVLVARNSHRSVFAAISLANAVPVYVTPHIHPLVGVPLGLDIQQVAAHIQSASDVAALHVTSPDYYGCCPDLDEVSKLAKRHRLPLIVDEAHGAHFSFLESLPNSAVEVGADIVIQGAHKHLGSLTQSAMLHWNRGSVPLSRLRHALSMLQSSSPSALLTASLDAARALMVAQGRQLLGQAVELAEQARAELKSCEGLSCFGDELVCDVGVASYDPTKLVVRVADLGLTGFAAARWLARRHGVEVELADSYNVVCSITFADTEESVAHLVGAFHDFAKSTSRRRTVRRNRKLVHTLPSLPQRALSFMEAHFAPTVRVAVAEAVSRIAAEEIIPYPPGIPVLLPGEVIDLPALMYLEALVADGAVIVGAEDSKLRRIRVVA